MPFPCDVCGKILRSRAAHEGHVQTHLRIRERTTCDICGKPISGKYNLERHKERMHNIPSAATMRKYTVPNTIGYQLDVKKKELLERQQRVEAEIKMWHEREREQMDNRHKTVQMKHQMELTKVAWGLGYQSGLATDSHCVGCTCSRPQIEDITLN